MESDLGPFLFSELNHTPMNTMTQMPDTMSSWLNLDDIHIPTFLHEFPDFTLQNDQLFNFPTSNDQSNPLSLHPLPNYTDESLLSDDFETDTDMLNTMQPQVCMWAGPVTETALIPIEGNESNQCINCDAWLVEPPEESFKSYEEPIFGSAVSADTAEMFVNSAAKKSMLSRSEESGDEEDTDEERTTITSSCKNLVSERRNPAYKGKWHPSSIDNPNYKGIWKPQQIPNPDYFELDRPDFEPVAAIGIEIWTMQDGILFDNILIASDEKVAESYREKTWKPKFEVEKAKEKAEDSASASDSLAGFKKKVFDVLYRIADIPFLEAYKIKIIDVIEKGEKQPNLTIGILVSIVVVFMTIIFRVLFGGKKPKPTVPVANVANETRNDGAVEATDNQGSSGEKEDGSEKEDAAAPRARRSRRET